jgi:tripartite-type tricarboxylate transporter receptor subunit TctC
MFDNVPSSMSHIQAGSLRPIATTTSNRIDSLPDTPTFVEEGINDFMVQSWFGLDAPAGTAAPIIAKLNTALNNALQSPEVIAIYKQNGFVAPAAPNSPESFKRYTEAETAQWAKVVEQGDIQVN